MSGLRDDKSAECSFGHHARCRNPECKCDCNHLNADNPIDAARAYSRWARSKNVRPLHLNLEKADARTIRRAADAIQSTVPAIAQMLYAESEKRQPQDPLSRAVRLYNRTADEKKWKPGYINLEKADSRVIQRAARICKDDLPEVSQALYAQARSMRLSEQPPKGLTAAVTGITLGDSRHEGLDCVLDRCARAAGGAPVLEKQ